MVDYTKPCFVDGEPVRILCADRPGTYPVLALDDDGGLYFRHADGTVPGYHPILNAPERESRFYRVYRRDTLAGPWDTLNEACASPYSHTTILEIEYEDGLPVSAKLHPVEEGK